MRYTWTQLGPLRSGTDGVRGMNEGWGLACCCCGLARPPLLLLRLRTARRVAAAAAACLLLGDSSPLERKAASCSANACLGVGALPGMPPCQPLPVNPSGIEEEPHRVPAA
jgi:hypothetical protein